MSARAAAATMRLWGSLWEGADKVEVGREFFQIISNHIMLNQDVLLSVKPLLKDHIFKGESRGRSQRSGQDEAGRAG